MARALLNRNGIFAGSPMVHLTARYSRLALLALFATLLVVRTVKLTPNELSWDVFGYYLPLPATFVHHDPCCTTSAG
jgi:hypothetical protein